MYAEEKLIKLVNAELALHLMDVRKLKERRARRIGQDSAEQKSLEKNSAEQKSFSQEVAANEQ